MRSKRFKMFFLIIALIGIAAVSVSNAYATVYGGIDFPQGEVSFADAVADYWTGPGTYEPNVNPLNALGAPDNNLRSLGQNGWLVLQFTDNFLTTSGNSIIDLWIFEVGLTPEPAYVSISTNGQDGSWIDVGEVAGRTSGVDIDAYVSDGQYSFVKLVDKNGVSSGPDIDAVGAYSSGVPVAPEPVSSVLFLIGGASLAARKWTRRKRQIN